MQPVGKSLPVAVGVIINPEQQVLLAWRDSQKSQGGCWEFPGGKIETGEDSYQALCRELQEEIDIIVKDARSLPSVTHHYETCQVILYPWLVLDYVGIPRGIENQSIIWTAIDSLRDLPLPGANYLIVDYLQSLNSKKNLIL